MPVKIIKNIGRKDIGREALARLTLVLLAVMLAAPASAKSPWEGIVEMIASRKAAAREQTTATAGNTLTVAALPMLREVPDEMAATSATQGRRPSLAALALNKVTSASAETRLATALSGLPDRDPKETLLGRESDENESMLAVDLFKKTEIRRLLGDEPRFIYNPEERPDPMIVPWVRRAAIFKELSLAAETLTTLGQLDKAVEVYQRIMQLDDPRYNGIVQAKLQAIAEKQNKAVLIMNAAKTVDEKVDLPAWIHDNTTGVIISPGHEMCLVGEYMLHSGDKVPNYPEVKVATITQRKVVYQIKSRTFEVVLNNN